MARKPNYGYEKHRRELEKKSKKEQKLQRKRERAENEREGQDEPAALPPDEGSATAE